VTEQPTLVRLSRRCERSGDEQNWPERPAPVVGGNSATAESTA
jgi:hypothetical protein